MAFHAPNCVANAAGDLLHLGNGRLVDAATGNPIRPPAGRRYHPRLTEFAVGGRIAVWLNGSYAALDLATEKGLPQDVDWYRFILPGSGPAAGYGNDFRRYPPPGFSPPADVLELWAQVAVRGELGPDGEFKKWDEAAWEQRRQELARTPPPDPHFPFPGHIAADRLHWLRAEFTAAKDADKIGLARELLRRAEAAGDPAEAGRWRREVERRTLELAPPPREVK